MTTSTEAPRIAAVTGGSAGIGKAICEDLLARGYEVISLARRPADIDHAKLHSIEVDLADRAATAQAVRELTSRFEVTTVIHNAGVIRAALLPEVKLDDLDALVDLHLGCAIQLVQAALPAMRARRFGRVVLLSSRAALGLATRTSYSATKAGMLGMARTWALELAADGITVNVVAPGPSSEAVQFLVEQRDVLGFGSESIGTDAGQGYHLRPPYPCHYYMHGAGRYGLQCLSNLDLLPPTGAVLICPPLKIQKGSGSPLRVLALVEGGA